MVDAQKGKPSRKLFKKYHILSLALTTAATHNLQMFHINHRPIANFSQKGVSYGKIKLLYNNITLKITCSYTNSKQFKILILIHTFYSVDELILLKKPVTHCIHTSHCKFCTYITCVLLYIGSN